MTPGTMEPAIGRVCVLNWFTNSPMLTPAGPSAVPTGGAGVAAPAAICNLMILVISLAIFRAQALYRNSYKKAKFCSKIIPRGNVQSVATVETVTCQKNNSGSLLTSLNTAGLTPAIKTEVVTRVYALNNSLLFSRALSGTKRTH